MAGELTYDLAAESVDLTQNNLKWGPSASGLLLTSVIWRGPCTSSYPTNFTNISGTLIAGTTTYLDTSAVTGTCYTYALVIGTTNSQSSVKTQTCAITGNSLSARPDLTSDSPDEALNELKAMLQPQSTQLNFSNPCKVCPVPNLGPAGVFLGTSTITLDCGKCTSFVIDTTPLVDLAAVGTTVRVNSINMTSCCDNMDIHPIQIFVPTDGIVSICGWPTGSGADGSECTNPAIGGVVLEG
jgi:hypothetical protein